MSIWEYSEGKYGIDMGFSCVVQERIFASFKAIYIYIYTCNINHHYFRRILFFYHFGGCYHVYLTDGYIWNVYACILNIYDQGYRSWLLG